MYKTLFLITVLLLTSTHGQAIDPQFKFEGYFGNPTDNIQNMNSAGVAFMPYNPVIIEVGAHAGAGTRNLASTYPYGKIFAFEPNPTAYSYLVENTQSIQHVFPVQLAVNTYSGSATLWGSDAKASLLPPENEESAITVPCVVLDEWCATQGISHVDFLRLDAGGIEWQILQSSPVVLGVVSVIGIKTHLSPSFRSVVSFRLLKMLVEDQGFELLSHRYVEGKEGEAIFVRKCLYDSIFD
ncbi:MAG: FkbM family methyltransferase [Parachlamydiaceae bacterium]